MRLKKHTIHITNAAKTKNDLFGLYAGDTCTEWYPGLETCERKELGLSHDNVNTILKAL